MMPGHTANSKQSEREVDKQPTVADNAAKAQRNTAERKTRERSSQKSRESDRAEGQLSKSDKDDTLLKGKPESVSSRESAKRISSRNQTRSRSSRGNSNHDAQKEENRSLGSRNESGIADENITGTNDNTGTEREGSGFDRVTVRSGSVSTHNFDWSNFTYKPIECDETKNPRAVLATGPEPCSCYPKTSTQTLSSMLYDKIRCIHCNGIGHTQANVIRFDDGWDSFARTSKKESFEIRSKSFFLGYPRPQLGNTVDDAISSNSTTHPRGTTSENASVSRMVNSRHSTSRESEAPSVGDIPFGVPRLGNTPQSGCNQSRQSDSNSVPCARDGTPRVINTVRTFRGKYFDIATGKIFEYEINPDYQRGANGWQTKRELINQED